MTQVLINDAKFTGQYVAIAGLSDSRVISSGLDPKEVYDAAILKGCLDPMIIYVPERDLVQIYKSF